MAYTQKVVQVSWSPETSSLVGWRGRLDGRRRWDPDEDLKKIKRQVSP